MTAKITVIGGGLAGTEAAWQIARRGLRVRFYEMRPVTKTAAHQTDWLGELVCSNSLKSDLPGTAPFLLKQELRRLGSLLIRIADQVKVPAGHALAVDREQFAARVTEAVAAEPRIELARQEVRDLPGEGLTIVATGPLTSGPLSAAIAELAGAGHLYFYDAISPIADATTLDESKLFRASRYGKVKILLPMLSPGLLAASVITFALSWSEFLYALILTATPRSQTFSIAVWSFVTEFEIIWNQMAAVGVISALVPVVLLLAARRYVISALTFGAVREKA